MSRVRLLVFVLLAVSASARPIDFPRPNEKWITLRVDEFTFVSNVSPAATTAVARDLLRMREAIGQVTKLNVRSPTPTRIFIFASERGFAPYREAVIQQNQEKIRGIFATADGGNFLLIKSDGSEDIDRTVYHELTHYFVRNTVAGLPLWASEGIAEYYSTFRVWDDKVHIGRPIAEHVRWLRQKPLISLRELLGTSVDSLFYDESARQGVFYAQSWAFFHYLMVDDARRAQLERYLDLVGKEKSVDDAFTAAFQTSYADMELELRAYVRRPAFTFTNYSVDELQVPEIPTPEAMPRDALLYELGHLLAHAAPAATEDARRFLEEALIANPEHSGAHADIGRLYHDAGQRKEADAAFARAVQLGNDDPLVHLLVGITALDGVKDVSDRASRESVLKARKAFERSAALQPTSARAWTGIGATYVIGNDDPEPGIAALEKSLALAPGDVITAFNLVQLYARAGRRADAERVIDTILVRGGAKKEILDFARETLLNDDLREIERLSRLNETEEAAKLARSVLERATNASLKKEMERTIAQLDEITRTNRSITTVNQAIVKANAGNVDEALAILDGALPEITDPATLSRAKELREKWAKRK